MATTAFHTDGVCHYNSHRYVADRCIHGHVLGNGLLRNPVTGCFDIAGYFQQSRHHPATHQRHIATVGTFMDMTPALLIFTPIFLPIAKSLGVDPIHFGIIINFNLCIGICTPPVGNALFVGSSIANVPVQDDIRQILPFYLVLFAVLMVVTLIPQLSLFIPSQLGY